MTPVSHPTPAQVRDWMRQRQANKTTPPTPEQVREQLGWHMIKGAARAR